MYPNTLFMHNGRDAVDFINDGVDPFVDLAKGILTTTTNGIVDFFDWIF